MDKNSALEICEEERQQATAAADENLMECVEKTIRNCVDRRRQFSLVGLHRKSVDKFTVCQITARIREGMDNFYEPAMVSIGPLHIGKPHLRTMQSHKWWHLSDLLNRNPRMNLETCIEELCNSEFRARTCYFNDTTNLSSVEFVKMLLLDASFIIEFLHKYDNDGSGIRAAYWIADPIWEDLLLLENQIPFFVVGKLSDLLLPTQGSKTTMTLATRFLSELNPSEQLLDCLVSDGAENTHHLLHLYHRITCLGTLRRGKENGVELTMAKSDDREVSDDVAPIPCAAELVMSGVKLKKKRSRYYGDVSFDVEDGVLEIPPFQIDQPKRARLLNLVAYEQCCSKEKIFSFYVRFLSHIINTKEDLNILEKEGIVTSHLRSKEDAINFFSKMNSYVVVKNDYHLNKHYGKINKYCSSWWNRSRGVLMKVHLANIWLKLSVFTAAALLMLAILQTFYTVYPYYKPHH